jgi:hypothetical protein
MYDDPAVRTGAQRGALEHFYRLADRELLQRVVTALAEGDRT